MLFRSRDGVYLGRRARVVEVVALVERVCRPVRLVEPAGDLLLKEWYRLRKDAPWLAKQLEDKYIPLLSGQMTRKQAYAAEVWDARRVKNTRTRPSSSRSDEPVLRTPDELPETAGAEDGEGRGITQVEEVVVARHGGYEIFRRAE